MAGLFDLIAGDGTSGGLLDFLRNNANAAVRTQTTGAPGDAASYDNAMPPQTLTQAATQPTSPAAPDNSAIQDAIWKAKQAASAPTDTAAPAPGPGIGGIPANPTVIAGQSAPGPSIFAPAAPVPTAPAAQTDAFGRSQSGPLSSGLQNFARVLSNVPRAGMDAPEVIARRDADATKAQTAQQQNQTAATLAKNGVDSDLARVAVLPGNGELLKTLIADKFGPAKAPTVLGQGYIWNPESGKVEKAFEAEGKIPVGFQKTADGKGMEPIPGGPADPKYIAAQVGAKGEGKMAPGTMIKTKEGDELVRIGEDGKPEVVYKNKSEGGLLSSEASKSIASIWLNGDHEVLRNLPKSAVVQVREDIMQQAKAAGMSERDITDAFNEQVASKAGTRTAAEMAAKVGVKAAEAANLIPIAEKAFDDLPNGEWVPANKLRNYVESNAGSPKQKAAGAAIQSLVNVYVNAISNGQPTDSMRAEAYHILDKADSPAAFHAAIGIMKAEINGALKAAHHATSMMNTGTGVRIDRPAAGSPAAAAQGTPEATPVTKSAPGTYSVPGHGTFTVEKVEQ